MFESKMRLVSIGIAAENKALDSHELPVVPIEIVPAMDGELLEALTEHSVASPDKNETETTVRVKTSSTLTATWLPHGSNRVTSPDVRRGEQVYIYQFADVDKYYWTTMGLDDDLRRLETVVYAWSAEPDDSVPLDIAENMYTLEVSTHGKHITLHTTQANGEPYEYSIQLDTDYGKFFVTDNVGNTVVLDTPKTKITAINKDKTEVSLDKTKLYGYAKDHIQTTSDGTHTSKSAKDFTVESGANINVSAAADINVEAGAKINITSGGDMLLESAGNLTGNVAGSLTMTAGGAVTLGAGGAVSMSNGAAGIKMNGAVVEIN